MKKFWNLSKVKNSDSAAELILYGDISEMSWWGDEITPKQFSDDLAALDAVTELSVRINSGGGDVFAGLAIHSMLKRHSANVTVYIDGLAASIASIIAMAGDKIIMPTGSMMMIHNPWTSAWGADANDLRQLADVLDKIRDSLVDVYVAKSGMTKDDIIPLLDAETWMSAEEAVEKGFADEIEQTIAVSASMRDKKAVINGVTMDWEKFKHAPELPQEVQNTTALPPVISSNDQPEAPLTDEEIRTLRASMAFFIAQTKEKEEIEHRKTVGIVDRNLELEMRELSIKNKTIMKEL